MTAGAAQRAVVPYGLPANRRALQTLADYMIEQGLLRDCSILDELFAETARE